MRIASWSWGGRDHVGTISAVRPRAHAAGRGRCLARRTGPDPVAGARREPLPPPSGARLPSEVVALRAPLPQPLRSLFCAGRNYRDHAAELATTVFRDSLPKEDLWPIVFGKLGECVVGPFDAVRLPGAAVSTQIDYESELAVVIGRGGRDIARSRAMDHVFGYTIVNDVTARDVQVRHHAVGPGQELRHLLPDGAVHRQRGRTRRPRHARARLGQRRAAPGRPHEAT